MPSLFDKPRHPIMNRRQAVQAGSIGLLGLGMNQLGELRESQADQKRLPVKARSVIYIFLSGGLSQLDSFDLKPEATAEIRGEFSPIETATPGMRICEHLPMLAQRSDRWALVRSLTHSTNDHSAGHLLMLSGRSKLSTGFSPSTPKSTDWPSIAAIAGDFAQARNMLPTSVVLPEKLVHYSGRIIPGQFAGAMGKRRDPWFIEASAYEPKAYGAFPEYEFDHQERKRKVSRKTFHTPNLSLPQGMSFDRFSGRLNLLKHLDQQRRNLDTFASNVRLDDHRQTAISLLTDAKIRAAIDVGKADAKTLKRYGNNSFGWSLLMARRLVASGVSLVQVNLGNNETWDTHGNIFPHLKNNLFPPTDRALSALLDDLEENGLLEETLIVMAGEFGRTPKISRLPQYYKRPGRDHWGKLQSVFFAGGGVKGGTVIGTSDPIGSQPSSDPQSPENMAATIYHSLGIPSSAAWYDDLNRPHFIYHDEPIPGLT